MADWNGQDPIKVGDRVTVIYRGKMLRYVTVRYLSNSFFVGLNQEDNEEYALPRLDVKFEAPITERDLVIQDMSKITGKEAKPFLALFGELYDAGYRK